MMYFLLPTSIDLDPARSGSRGGGGGGWGVGGGGVEDRGPLTPPHPINVASYKFIIY